VNCHHNYAEREDHFGENVIVTRKGAVRARVGDMGIIPGSMGTRSYIVEGLGNEESFCSCSHGAGRVMSRSKAKQAFTLEDVELQTDGIVCRKDEGIIDELPLAYKNIDTVMEHQKDLVKIKAQLRQVLCVKG
jgi:tRNA-splicing ligase RtcB